MTVIIIIFTYGAVVHYLMDRSLKRTLDPDTKVLIILGASIKDNRITPTLHSRLEKGAKLLKEYPDLTAIVTGGNGSETAMSEAKLMKEVLVEEFGIDENRIQMEDKSQNTYENLLYTKPMVKEQKAAIVTSEFHTIRTELLAKRVGVEAQTLGAKTPIKKRLKLELREHLAIVKSWFFDTY